MEQDKILRLIESKSFRQLTPAERELVLVSMTESEYELQFELINRSQQLFADEANDFSPSPAILSSLKAKLQKEKPAPWYILMFQFQLPAYQSAIAIAAILFFVWSFWPTTQNQIAEKEVIVYQAIHDTIEVVKEIPIERLVTIVKEVKVEVPIYTEATSISEGITPVAVPISATAISQNLANTSLDAQQLNQFLVGVH